VAPTMLVSGLFQSHGLHQHRGLGRVLVCTCDSSNLLPGNAAGRDVILSELGMHRIVRDGIRTNGGCARVVGWW
jgi:hypothetical protein